MSTRRLFFALWPEEPMREALAAAVGGAIAAMHGCRPVPLANLHVTLAFLGAVPEAALGALTELAGEVSRRPALAHPAPGPTDAVGGMPADHGHGQLAHSALEIQLDTIEHWRRAEILCAAASRMPAAAEELSRTLRTTLLAGGFHPDLKPFRAHVTLARHIRRAPRDLGMPVVTWSFDEFALIESRTHPEGPTYSVVDSWVLGGGMSQPPSSRPSHPAPDRS